MVEREVVGHRDFLVGRRPRLRGVRNDGLAGGKRWGGHSTSPRVCSSSSVRRDRLSRVASGACASIHVNRVEGPRSRRPVGTVTRATLAGPVDLEPVRRAGRGGQLLHRPHLRRLDPLEVPPPSSRQHRALDQQVRPGPQPDHHAVRRPAQHQDHRGRQPTDGLPADQDADAGDEPHRGERQRRPPVVRQRQRLGHQRVLPSVPQQQSQPGPATGAATLHRPGGHPEDRRGLVHRIALDVDQHQRHPLVVVELRQGRRQVVAQLLLLHRVGRRLRHQLGGPVRVGGQWLLGLLTLLLPQPVETGVDHDPVQPGAHLGLAPEPVGAAEGGQVGVLQGVGGVVRVAHHAQRHGPQPVLVPVHQRGERVRVTGDVGREQIGVGRCGRLGARAGPGAAVLRSVGRRPEGSWEHRRHRAPTTPPRPRRSRLGSRRSPSARRSDRPGRTSWSPGLSGRSSPTTQPWLACPRYATGCRT